MAKPKTNKKNGTKKKRGAELSIADIMGAKKPRTIDYLVCLDNELAEAKFETAKIVADLERRIQAKEMLANRGKNLPVGAAKDKLDEDLADLEAELEEARTAADEAEEAADEVSVDFTFQAIGRMRLEALQRAHKPSADQVREFKKGLKEQGLPDTELNYDPDKFPPALIAAAAAHPVMTDEEALEMWNSAQFSNGELNVMFQTAWQVNNLIAT